MKITFELDRTEKLDPYDPLGNLTISDGQKCVAIEATYLDSWFAALIKGLESLPLRQKVTITVLEEPDSLVLIRDDKKTHVVCQGQSLDINVSDIQDFKESLRFAIQDFLAQLEADDRSLADLPNLKELYQFIH
jgi:hypothetical protein